MTTRIEDFYDTGEEFESVVRKAIAETDSDKGLDFLVGLEESWQRYGMRGYFSFKQNEYLCRLAGMEE